VQTKNLYEEFWNFASERQNVFYKKLKSGTPPYTNDTVLNKYKFCNAYRVLDRVSQYLLKNVIYNGKIYSGQDTVFRIVFFKIFNLPSTWEYLINNIGDITLENFNINKISILLSDLQKIQPIYNSAYISCANKVFGYDKKHDNHLHLLHKMFIEDKVADKILKCKDMENAFNILVSFPLIGNFMAYQLVTDINYSDTVDFTEDSFTVAGPGSKRGIQKIFNTTKHYEDYITKAYNEQGAQFKKYNLDFRFLGNRKLQLIDIQNLFCEFDKYCRKTHPEIISNRKEIKKKYLENNKKIDYMLPPKWNATI
jgi:hypothetical protein